MIALSEKHLKIVKDVLSKYPYAFYAFGSRVKKNHKTFSDLDICFMEPIPLNVLAHIDEDFEESDLPFKVDVVNYLTCDKNFRDMIKKDLVLLSSGTHGDFKKF